MNGAADVEGMAACKSGGYLAPEWQELGSAFRVTFYPHSDITARLDSDVPINVSVNVPVNARQQWFLNQLGVGEKVKADFARHWNVALKTAKRDIADLKEQGIIEFVGPPKTGIYRLMQDLAMSIDR